MIRLILAYLHSAWATVLYFGSPLHWGELAGGILILLLLRIFLGGIGGKVIRLIVYAGLYYAVITYDQFRLLFPEGGPRPGSGSESMVRHIVNDVLASRYPDYVIAAILLIGLWLPINIVGGIVRRMLGLGRYAESYAGDGYATNPGDPAPAGQPYEVQQRTVGGEKKQSIVIMMTDIAGYSAKMEKDETATYALLKEHNTIMRRNIAAHRGKEIKTIGDAFMVTFQQPADALNCAIKMQRDLHAFNKPRPAHDQLKIRIGINRGEVIVTAKDVFGEGVNIAARMESITEIGGISISADIYEAVKGKIEAGFQDIGIPKMKNIANPPQVYRVQLAH
jgi:class 3 adenylate cyclase